MQYREFGKDKEQVSVLGFGTMRLPILDGDSARINESEAIRQIRYAIDGGVNYIDTAYPYHQGNSEKLVAKALADGYREKVKIATKCPSWLINSSEDMDRYLDDQLVNLNTDHIDYYLLHTLNQEYWDNFLENNVFDFIGKALADGRIRKIGFSFHDQLDLFKEIIDSYDWDFCQIQYNILDEDYQAGKAGLDYAYAKGISVVIMEPLRGGSLVTRIPEDVMSIWNEMKADVTPVGWCMRHIWDHPGVSVVLSGMNQMEHIEENLKEAELASAGSLSELERENIARVREIYLSRMQVHCTDCGYCMPCPYGVNIPGNFTFYNEGFMFQDLEMAKDMYHKFMPVEKQAGHCVECGRCKKLCPQGIDIPERLKDVQASFKK
jgi:hypothetical protein